MIILLKLLTVLGPLIAAFVKAMNEDPARLERLRREEEERRDRKKKEDKDAKRRNFDEALARGDVGYLERELRRIEDGAPG